MSTVRPASLTPGESNIEPGGNLTNLVVRHLDQRFSLVEEVRSDHVTEAFRGRFELLQDGVPEVVLENVLVVLARFSIA